MRTRRVRHADVLGFQYRARVVGLERVFARGLRGSLLDL
jgi:hypothetical protein